MENKKTYWTICPKCYGRGKKYLKLRKKARLRYQLAMSEFEKPRAEGNGPKGRCLRGSLEEAR